ncbi:MAG: RNA polymerase sigma-70 factor [Bacteroidales bacterium]|nr:RNA polymerase sigma-70 factor [Bacteroidales bacterium]
MDPQKDILLFNQLKKGSKAAFDELFRVYYKPLCRYCYQYVKDKDTTDEVVQEFFVRLWEQKETIAIQKSLMAYLYVSVKNTALNYLQKKNTRMSYEQAYAEMSLKKDDTENKLTSEEINALVQKGMEALPEKCRLVFYLSRNEGLTNEEIANYLNLSYKTVENQMTKAFHKLRATLKPMLEKLFL